MTKRSRPLAGFAAALVIGIPSSRGQRCGMANRPSLYINRSSGTTWQIKVDYDHNTVDTNPASISDAEDRLARCQRRLALYA